ncbi:ABC transporter substrate-binding protein [Undibacterium sp. SXout7W]|uniref:ABC transporter substrate-binding protein n=1 Tax=Undibacterium sp. SXout7W TaxID=3413049 RepID=UPI003BEFC747
MFDRTIKKTLASTILSALLALASVHTHSIAADLKIGLAADVSSLDPHYLNIAPNISFASHLFDALVHIDANGRLIPGLATSWKAIDATTWEFKLRKGVKFHDGTELTAEDVIFSLDRPALLTNSPGPFTSYTKQIIAKQATDAYTIRLKTAAPYGPLPLDLSSIFIVSKKVASRASSDDFNSGKALIGTGPFKFVSFKRSDSITIARNDQYWGEKSSWDKVIFRIMTSGAPRVAALLSGDVDVIDAVPPADVNKLKSNNKFRLEQKISWRTLFWQLDQQAHSSPFITDKAGKPLAENPLRDIRVRQAISKAIHRTALTEKTLEGLAVPASNIVAPGIMGYNSSLKAEAYDLEGAKKLLTAAGYPNGFGLTLHGPNNRYINDEQVIQTIAQFLTKAGIQTKVETLPLAAYFPRAGRNEFSMALLGWGTLATDFGLRTLTGTNNPETGWGTWNWGKYSNPTLDKAIQLSLSTVDESKREELAKKAATIALSDYAVIPLYHQYASWAMRKGVKYIPRTDEFTFAHQFHPE